LARSFANSNVPPAVGIDLLFLDGGATTGRANPQSHAESTASTYFAHHLGELYGNEKPLLAIIVDNVCRGDLQLLKEESSSRNAPAQLQAIWNAAQRVSPRIFRDRLGPEI